MHIQVRFTRFIHHILLLQHLKVVALFTTQRYTHMAFESSSLTAHSASSVQVKAKMKEIYDSLLKAFPEVPITILSTNEAVTFSRHYPFRPIQVMGYVCLD